LCPLFVANPYAQSLTFSTAWRAPRDHAKYSR